MFKDKICVISGGALGIGRCLTREFAKAGAKIAFVDMNEEAGKVNAAYLKQQGCETLFFLGDISEEETLRLFADSVIEKFGHVDILINNAFFSKGGIHTPCSYNDFNLALRMGVTAPYMLAQLFSPYFREGAAIVNMTSTRAHMSQANTESYTAAKGAISALTHALAVSLAGKVRVNSVAPGWIDTGSYHDESYEAHYSAADTAQHPAKRVGDPLDIASAVMFLCDERNSFITGENLVVDGGMSKLMIYSGDEGWEYTPSEIKR
ncbi:MAG: SDR family oxidoreductase [Eubacteriales bacterium]|nr:SDR family oxidoreductase [Eubacteriales bacterium]MDD4541493.1 SDR family oxidoreductase [Eubacteriales bacterium]